MCNSSFPCRLEVHNLIKPIRYFVVFSWFLKNHIRKTQLSSCLINWLCPYCIAEYLQSNLYVCKNEIWWNMTWSKQSLCCLLENKHLRIHWKLFTILKTKNGWSNTVWHVKVYFESLFNNTLYNEMKCAMLQKSIYCRGK